MLRVVVLLAASAGCASVPEANTTNVRGAELYLSDDGTEITGTGFTMTFAKSGIRLPTSLIHTTEVFGASSCPTPSRAGVVIDPIEIAAAEHTPMAGLDPTKNTLTALRTGPAVIQMQVAYDVPYDCFGRQSLRGTASFTVYPSGRTVRHDSVQPATTPISDSLQCTATCDGTVRAATLRAFWALAPSGVRSQIVGPQEVPIGKGSRVSTLFSCAAYTTHTAAIAWNAVTDATASESPNGPLVYEHELATPVNMIPATTFEVSSTLFVLPGMETCATAASAARLPQTLVIDGTAVALDAFEMYTDLTPKTGRIELRTSPDQAIGSGFAVRLVIGAPDHLSVKNLAGVALTPTLQTEDGDTIIWIPDGLATDDAVIIEGK